MKEHITKPIIAGNRNLTLLVDETEYNFGDVPENELQACCAYEYERERIRHHTELSPATQARDTDFEFPGSPLLAAARLHKFKVWKSLPASLREKLRGECKEFAARITKTAPSHVFLIGPIETMSRSERDSLAFHFQQRLKAANEREDRQKRNPELATTDGFDSTLLLELNWAGVSSAALEGAAVDALRRKISQLVSARNPFRKKRVDAASNLQDLGIFRVWYALTQSVHEQTRRGARIQILKRIAQECRVSEGTLEKKMDEVLRRAAEKIGGFQFSHYLFPKKRPRK